MKIIYTILFILIFWVSAIGQVNVDSLFYAVVKSNSSSQGKIKSYDFHKVYDEIAPNFPEHLTDTLFAIFRDPKTNYRYEFYWRLIVRVMQGRDKGMFRKRALEETLTMFQQNPDERFLYKFVIGKYRSGYSDLTPKDFSKESNEIIYNLLTKEGTVLSPVFFMAGYSGNKKFIPIIREYIQRDSVTTKMIYAHEKSGTYLPAYCALSRLGDKKASKFLIKTFRVNPDFFGKSAPLFGISEFYDYLFYTRSSRILKELIKDFINSPSYWYRGMKRNMKKYGLPSYPDSIMCRAPDAKEKLNKWYKKNKRKIRFKKY